MKRIPVIMAVVSIFLLSSCDEGETAKPQVRFSSTSSEVYEDLLRASIEIVADKPASEDILVPLQLGGNAVEGEDYFIIPVATIPQGATTTIVNIDIVNDNEYEPAEFIQLEIHTVAGGAAAATDLNHELDILNDDNSFLKIDLSWEAGDGTPGDVDMDLVVWKRDSANPDAYKYFDRAAAGGTTFEQIVLSGHASDGVYGLTFQYWEGSSDDVTFTVTYTIIGEGSVAGQASMSYQGHYTLANVNPSWDVQIEQTFEKTAYDYVFSPITVPDSGSRIKTLRQPYSKQNQ
ncbi:MAG TPA: hypothetical protein VEB86_20130 [Chryseosolibacter sp.]|nr:hypothetical protein [Chryseosolibacter sp.]